MKQKYITLAAIVVAFIILLPACSFFKPVSLTSTAVDGLVAYYPFDLNAKDKSGKKNHGKVYGATLTTGRDGKASGAYYFNGKRNYIAVRDSKTLRIEKQITMSVWFKTGIALPFAGIIGKIDPKEPRRGYLITINDYNKVRVDLSVDHSKAIGGIVVSKNDLVDDEWHHVVSTMMVRK